MTRSLVRWNPRGSLFRTQMGRLIDDAFNDFLAPVNSPDEELGTDWAPAVDILEDDDKLVFSSDMPGLDRDQVEITLENQVLTLRGERKLDRDDERNNYHRIERTYGSFSRSFKLPNNVDTAAAKATFDNGILNIELPKREDAKPKKLEIS